MAKQTGIQKKISVKSVFGQKMSAVLIAKHAATVDDQLHAMAVMGVASGVKVGSSDHGDWKAVTGTFKAVNPHTSEEFLSSTCFLPDVAMDMIYGEVKNGARVEFAFNIIAELNAESDVGFIYKAVPLFKEEFNPLKALEERLKGGTLALPAPTKKGGKTKALPKEEASAE